MEWTKVPAGDVNKAFVRLMESFGHDASAVIDLINHDQSFVSAWVAQANKLRMVPRNERVVSLEVAKRDHVVRTLEHAHGNKAAAAKILGITRHSLYRLIKRHALDQVVVRAVASGE